MGIQILLVDKEQQRVVTQAQLPEVHQELQERHLHQEDKQ